FAAGRLHYAFAGLERAAITASKSPLLYLAPLLARNGKPEEAWRRLEEAFGRGLFDDLSAREALASHLTAAERQRQQELTAKLTRVEKLSPRAPGGPNRGREDRARQYSPTKADHRASEAELARKYGVPQGAVYDLARVQAQLPADTALLAWLDFWVAPK